jgi:hypothetical protein
MKNPLELLPGRSVALRHTSSSVHHNQGERSDNSRSCMCEKDAPINYEHVLVEIREYEWSEAIRLSLTMG